jgi:hypothetical protein
MRYREVLKHYKSVSWQLQQKTREKESMKMNYYKSMESSDCYYDKQPSRTYPSTNKRRDDPKQNYDGARYRCHETRMRYMQTWNELEACQEEMESSEINYFKTLQAFRFYHKSNWFGQRNDELYKRLEDARLRLSEARQHYDQYSHEMDYHQRRRDSSEKDYYDALQALEGDVDMINEKNVSSIYRSYGSSVSNFHTIEPARTVDDEQRDIVRQLISKQNFDGSWDMDSKTIEELIGKSLTDLQQWPDTKVLTSAIIIAVLETRFVSLSSMWYAIVQKARKRLNDVLNKDNKKLDTLIEDIKKQL